jgi:FlaG/FlaF family flagellin (archaellin)
VGRALSSTVGIVLLVAVTTLVAAAAGVVVTVDPGPRVPTARLSLSADAATDRVALTHEGGETLDVSELSVTVTVDGERLDRQPPVPFFAAGETAGVRIASTNHPRLSDGARVEVTVTTDAGVVVSLEATAT